MMAPTHPAPCTQVVREKFNLRADNPLIILDQETSKIFATLKPKGAQEGKRRLQLASGGKGADRSPCDCQRQPPAAPLTGQSSTSTSSARRSSSRTSTSSSTVRRSVGGEERERGLCPARQQCVVEGR